MIERLVLAEIELGKQAYFSGTGVAPILLLGVLGVLGGFSSGNRHATNRPSTEHARARPSTPEHRAPSTEHRAPSTEHDGEAEAYRRNDADPPHPKVERVSDDQT